MNRSGLFAAWAAGEAIVIWRMVHKDQHLPVPGALLGITLLFLAGGLVADIYPRSAPLVTLGFVGLDVAALLNVLPAGLGGQISQAETTSAQAEGVTAPSQFPGNVL